MMKTSITVLILLFTALRAIAYVCEERSITEKFVQSDFVAHAKIVKAYENQEEEPFYKADNSIYELYKGEKLKSIYIWLYPRQDLEFL